MVMGHFMNTYTFPLKRQIPIIANIEDLQREKYDNGTYVSEAFDNNLSVSFLAFFLRAVVAEILIKPSTMLWLLAIIISWVIDSNEQHRVSRPILLILFLIHVLFGLILQYQSLKSRRVLTIGQPSRFRVYHYDLEHNTAEWIHKDATELKPGNIYKLPMKCQNVPVDSILLHGNPRIIQVD